MGAKGQCSKASLCLCWLDTTVAISFLRTISKSELVVCAHAWPWFDEEGSRNAAPGTPMPRSLRSAEKLATAAGRLHIFFLRGGEKKLEDGMKHKMW